MDNLSNFYPQNFQNVVAVFSLRVIPTNIYFHPKFVRQKLLATATAYFLFTIENLRKVDSLTILSGWPVRLK